jgi:hypothetical protein
VNFGSSRAFDNGCQQNIFLTKRGPKDNTSIIIANKISFNKTNVIGYKEKAILQTIQNKFKIDPLDEEHEVH